MSFDPKLDLVLERAVDVPPSLVWKAWTEPKHLLPWFTPAPWRTVECEIDLRPGGRFYTVMLSPEGERMPGDGCYLEVVPERRLVWTSALGPGFRPVKFEAPKPDSCDFAFTAILTLEPHGANGTLYRAQAMHADEAACKLHASMGFEAGWGVCLDQLVAYVKTL